MIWSLGWEEWCFCLSVHLCSLIPLLIIQLGYAHLLRVFLMCSFCLVFSLSVVQMTPTLYMRAFTTLSLYLSGCPKCNLDIDLFVCVFFNFYCKCNWPILVVEVLYGRMCVCVFLTNHAYIIHISYLELVYVRHAGEKLYVELELVTSTFEIGCQWWPKVQVAVLINSSHQV